MQADADLDVGLEADDLPALVGACRRAAASAIAASSLRLERFESGPKAWAHGLYENASRLSAEDRAFVRKLYALDSQLHALLCGAPPSPPP